MSTDAVAMCMGIIDSMQKLVTYAVAMCMGIIDSTQKLVTSSSDPQIPKHICSDQNR